MGCRLWGRRELDMAEMNQTVSLGQQLQAKVLHKKRWAQEKLGWFTNINERD